VRHSFEESVGSGPITGPPPGHRIPYEARRCHFLVRPRRFARYQAVADQVGRPALLDCLVNGSHATSANSSNLAWIEVPPADRTP
jgi:hypothetical protein